MGSPVAVSGNTTSLYFHGFVVLICYLGMSFEKSKQLSM
ncbi:hypothetical protein PPEP_a0803 [Pseudoalteromonas peptidolytica F12-50-A1]|uniref:Uncharacterized protein n=1 Tax=Pseudoalteromonas peptidolytica F12-50-A1 TaxID=1315280 RepID=A0A8I0MV60_9GAMM|nr:hypothetical protein [Pseudoalteromonas peptidolytica F12-50-A1]